MNFLSKKILGGFLLAWFLSVPLQAAEDVSGVVLSFDDTYVDHWYDYFGQRTDDVKTTLFVSHWHTLSAAEKEKLSLLRDKGHEIGNHTYSHKGVAGDFNFDPNRIQEYLNDQIIPSLANMQADGFFPVSFSYPSGERNEVYDAAVRQYFPYLRTTFADENREMFQMDDIYHGPQSNYGVLAGDGIDNDYNNPIAEIEAAFLRAKTNNEIVTLYAHRIVADGSPDADHRFGIRVSKLNRVIAAAKEMGLKFYTFEEAWQIGNQGGGTGGSGGTGGTGSGSDNIEFLGIDSGKARFQWTNLPTDFIGIVPVGVSEWREGMPGAEAHGDAASKIGIRVAGGETDQQYVAIFYQNNSEVGRSGAFTVVGTGETGGGTGTGETGGGTGTGETGGGTGTGETGGGTGTGGSSSDNIVFLGIDSGKVRFQWSNLPTDFIGIAPAGASAWQEGMPGAEAHGDAASKIGIRVAAGAADQQYVAIFYKGSAEVGRSETFIIAGTGTGGTGETGGGTGTGGTGETGGGTGTGETGNGTIVFLGIDGRKARFQWSNLPTDFIGIVPVGTAAWQEGMVGADAHGAAADKIGLRISSLDTSLQYVAIFYQNSAEVGRSEIFMLSGI